MLWHSAACFNRWCLGGSPFPNPPQKQPPHGGVIEQEKVLGSVCVPGIFCAPFYTVFHPPPPPATLLCFTPDPHHTFHKLN